MKKIIGVNYLHTHSKEEQKLELDRSHVIVDRKDLIEVIDFFRDNPIFVDWIGKGVVAFDLNTQKPMKAPKL